MQFTERVTTITREDILPKVYDNILSDNVITYRIMGTGKKFTSYDARPIVKLYKNTQGSSFSGMDTLATGTVNVRRKMTFEPKAYSIPVAIPNLDQAVNDTESQVLSLMKVEMESSAHDACDDLAGYLYADGTGNDGKDFNGFGNLIDDGTVASTVGTLSRTTYPTLQGTRTDWSSVVSLAKLQTMVRSVSAGSVSKQRPTMIISDEASVDYYEQLLTPTMRAAYEAAGGYMVTRRSKAPIKANQFSGDGGIMSLTYKGIPWVGDEKAPSAKTWFVNENYLFWLGLKSKKLSAVNFGSTHDGAVEDAPSKNTGLQWRDFMDSYNQFAEVGQIFALGELITTAPRRMGVGLNSDGI